MNTQSKLVSFTAKSLGLAALFVVAPGLSAQTAYGVDALGGLFYFEVSQPGTVYSVGNLGFTPEAIDFRPGTSTLYAVDVDATNGNGSLFTVNTATGAATLIGTGFNSPGLVGATSIAFDFNPTTLQPDTSIRIRLVGNNGTNLRLHSDTGGLAATDTTLGGVPGAVVSGAAYTNSDIAVAPAGGTTALYYIDSANDSLLLSSNPNGGVVGAVGPLGADVGVNLGFDIYSGGSSDIGYVVDTTGGGVANFYSVDLATGAATPLGTILRSFAGGFAVEQLAAIPEPSTFAALAGLGALGLVASRRRRAGQ